VLLRAMEGAMPPLEAYPASQREDIERQQQDLPLRGRPQSVPESSRA